MSNLASLCLPSADWLTAIRLWLPRIMWVRPTAPSEPVQRFHLAFQRAYRRLAQTHPAWVHRCFDDHFLRQTTASVLMQYRQTDGSVLTLPTGTELMWAWDKQFGFLAPSAVRSRQSAELVPIATGFLRWFAAELEQLAPERASARR